jgi:hypothetical protein
MSIDDTYVETVTGSARSTAILVFSDPQFQLIADARKNLIHNRKLNRDEYFSNFSADIRKELIFGIVYVTKVIVSADVMQNHNEPRPELKMTSQLPKSPNQHFISGTDTFRLGETVYYTRNKSYYSKATIDFINGEEVTFLMK